MNGHRFAVHRGPLRDPGSFQEPKPFLASGALVQLKLNRIYWGQVHFLRLGLLNFLKRTPLRGAFIWPRWLSWQSGALVMRRSGVRFSVLAQFSKPTNMQTLVPGSLVCVSLT